jgi:hypothetical protein
MLYIVLQMYVCMYVCMYVMNVLIRDAETGDYYRTLEGHILAVTGIDINVTGEGK